jgi:maleylacetate reductase
LIVRWGLQELAPTLAELGIERPLLVSTERWQELELPVAERFHGVKPHAEQEGVSGAIERAREVGADGLVGLGGGSAIDSTKAVSAETGMPVVSVPTTYAGAEWTPYFGIRDETRGVKGGGMGARLAGAIYEVQLTLTLPRAESGGTALNALAHCAEALYVKGRNEEGDRYAREGATLINASLPAVLENGSVLGPRKTLLTGAMHAGAALASAGLGLGHAMAQALGGRYGLPHGALNAICLPPALRFNEPVAARELETFGDAMGTDDPIGRVERLGRLAGFTRLRELGVPEAELDEIAEAAANRAGARNNPRPAGPTEIAQLLRSVW